VPKAADQVFDDRQRGARERQPHIVVEILSKTGSVYSADAVFEQLVVNELSPFLTVEPGGHANPLPTAIRGVGAEILIQIPVNPTTESKRCQQRR